MVKVDVQVSRTVRTRSLKTFQKGAWPTSRDPEMFEVKR